MELHSLIAERHLILRTPKGKSPVTVQIGAPHPSADQKDWQCPYRLHGLSDKGWRFSAGLDAVQALELVTQMIEADLFALNQHHNGGLCWPAGTPYFQVTKPTKLKKMGKKR
jgi:hypothetical protein